MKLKPWYQVVTPREDLREERPHDASEFAVNLAHIAEGRPNVSKDYADPARFFGRTLLTKSLMGLATEVARRLNGVTVETNAIFNMATQFGGGKTHSLTALYHLARHGRRARSFQGVESVLLAAGVESVPEAAAAVFVGKDFDSLTGRGGPGEPVRKTPWGEIAWQLGGADSYRIVEQHDREFIEPKGDAIRAMLPKDRPSIILMDEILSYVSTYRARGYGDRLYNFIDCLAETARGEKNVVLVVSIPASELEYTAEDSADEARFKKMLDRLGRAISMSSDAEVSEIIRRRLFEWHGIPEDGLRTVTAYAEWVSEHAAELTNMGGGSGESVADAFRATYPFHPTVISVFERKWQSLPRFQRTRGVLRLLALWVARTYQEDHRRASKEPLITLGSAPLDDQVFRDAVFEQLGSDGLVVPVTTDIAGKKDAHAVRLDREATESISKARLHQRVATAIFFESNGGQSESKAEASEPEIKAALGGPEFNLAEIGTVTDGLVANCFYLTWDRNRYRFGLRPNLNQMLVTRRAAVSPKAIAERVKKEIVELFKEGQKGVERKYFPVRSNDIPDRPVLTLSVLGFETPHGDPATMRLVEGLIRESGTTGRTFKSALLFAVPEASAAATEDARSVLAWEDIAEDAEAKARFDENQQRTLVQSLRRAKADLRESIFRAYRHVYLLKRDNAVGDHDLGQINSSTDPSIVNLMVSDLQRLDEIIPEAPSPRKIVNVWPPALTEWSTKAVRDAFFSSPVLPRLLKPEAIRKTIADGVTQGLLGYAQRDGTGQPRLLRFGEGLSEADVAIDDDTLILKAEDAKKLQEPPRLARIAVAPDGREIGPTEAVAFAAQGFTQYGDAVEVSALTWAASGGTIDDAGRFVAGEQPGVFAVRAASGSVVGAAEVCVRFREHGDESGPERGTQAGAQLLLWSGEVPAQKWMNFYTKVLSRFAGVPGLRLTVSFEAPANTPDAKAKAEEAKAALRELGLDDGLTGP